jgi:hypothetical protein
VIKEGSPDMEIIEETFEDFYDDGFDTCDLLEVKKCHNCGEYFTDGIEDFCSKSCLKEHSKYTKGI